MRRVRSFFTLSVAFRKETTSQRDRGFSFERLGRRSWRAHTLVILPHTVWWCSLEELNWALSFVCAYIFCVPHCAKLRRAPATVARLTRHRDSTLTVPVSGSICATVMKINVVLFWRYFFGLLLCYAMSSATLLVHNLIWFLHFFNDKQTSLYIFEVASLNITYLTWSNTSPFLGLYLELPSFPMM